MPASPRPGPARPTTGAPSRPAAGELEALRARTLAELEHQLELRRLDRPEFERRAARAVDAASALELRPLVADLIAPDTQQTLTPSGAAAPQRGHPDRADARDVARRHGDAEQADEHDWAIAILSGSNRSGRWEPAEHVTALAVMGGIRLDFREAAFLEGVVTKVSAFCVMGGIEIIVPPDIHVSVAGTGLLGGVGHVSQTAPSSDAPRLHVSALALMGGIDIKVRELAEAAADAPAGSP